MSVKLPVYYNTLSPKMRRNLAKAAATLYTTIICYTYVISGNTAHAV